MNVEKECEQAVTKPGLTYCHMQAVALFVVQPTAIQQYVLATAQCRPDAAAANAPPQQQQPSLSPASSAQSLGEQTGMQTAGSTATLTEIISSLSERLSCQWHPREVHCSHWCLLENDEPHVWLLPRP